MNESQRRFDRRRKLVLGASAALLPLRDYAQSADAYVRKPGDAERDLEPRTRLRPCEAGMSMQLQARRAWELIDAGTVRLLVSWGPTRNKRSLNVPILKELYGIVSNSPWGIAGPKGLDPRVVRIVHDTFRKASADPAFVQTLERVGMEVYYMAGEEYLKWRRETAAFEKAAVERLGLQLK